MNMFFYGELPFKGNTDRQTARNSPLRCSDDSLRGNGLCGQKNGIHGQKNGLHGQKKWFTWTKKMVYVDKKNALRGQKIVYVDKKNGLRG